MTKSDVERLEALTFLVSRLEGDFAVIDHVRSIERIPEGV